MKVHKKFIRDGIEYLYISYCCGYTRKDIAKRYNVPVKDVIKISSYMASIIRKV